MRISILKVLIVAALIVVTAAALVKTRPSKNYESFSRRPMGIMGTDSNLLVTVPRGSAPHASENILRNAEAVLRKTETLMSVHIDGTELSRFNEAPAGPFKLSPQTLEVLRAAYRLYRATEGAFDITCQPLIRLWKQAAEEARLPSTSEIKKARALSNWAGLGFMPGGIIKKSPSVRLDLGGIAKGHAIDRALEAVRSSGAEGGLVDVGGDLRLFGRSPAGHEWEIGIKHPFRPDAVFASLGISDGAVCTSGNYFRFVEIQGKRFSHIIDPRTGMPVDAAASVTVIAPTAITADAWATALSVLGPEGLKIIPKDQGIEAMMVTGPPENSKVYTTDGFKKLLISEPNNI